MAAPVRIGGEAEGRHLVSWRVAEERPDAWGEWHMRNRQLTSEEGDRLWIDRDDGVGVVRRQQGGGAIDRAGIASCHGHDQHASVAALGDLGGVGVLDDHHQITPGERALEVHRLDHQCLSAGSTDAGNRPGGNHQAPRSPLVVPKRHQGSGGPFGGCLDSDQVDRLRVPPWPAIEIEIGAVRPHRQEPWRDDGLIAVSQEQGSL